ncbi:MAG: ATP-binding protein [Candidatus Falkowbacteria bacterium]
MNTQKKGSAVYLIILLVLLLLLSVVFWIYFSLNSFGVVGLIDVNSFVILIAIFFILLLSLAIFYANEESKKIKKIDSIIKEIGAQNFDIKIGADLLNSAGAVGSVALSLERAISNLNSTNKSLNLEIANRTSDLALEAVKFDTAVNDLEKFKLAVDNASDHIVITDPEGIVIYANKMVEKITGYSRAEVIGTKAGKLWNMPMSLDFYKKLWDTIKNKKTTFTGELNNRRKNGEVYDATASISPALDKNKNILYFIGIERDITNEKNIDRAKTEFVSLASHQLRSPLSIIKWYVEMLLAGDAGDVPVVQRTLLDEIYLGNQRMINLVNSLLSVSRIELGTFIIDPKECLFSDVVNTVILEQDHNIKTRSIKFSLDYDALIPPIMLDWQLMHIVVENLITNAIKYTPVGGEVKFTAKIEGKNLKITVSDTGIGIPSLDQTKIFSKLYRSDNARLVDVAGNGLGLYLTKMIVDSCGGTISFVSTENIGTTFTVLLPKTGMIKKDGTKRLE